jgi:methionyl-tRNA formyltransferase
LQKAVFTRLKTGKTLQFHDPVVFHNPSEAILSLIPQVGVAIYDPQTDSLVVRCASDTVLSVRKVQQQDKKAMEAKPWWNGVRPEMRSEPHADNGPIIFI